MKKKILLTGGAGFIGSHIADRFIYEGFEVVIIDNLSTGYEKNINKKAKFYKLDIQDQQLEHVFNEEKPDFVSHQAAQKDVRLSVADPIHDADINILGTLNILQNCVKHKVKKVVFASTGGAIYGEQETFPASETHPTRPISPYGITKLVVEHYLYYYKTIYGLEYAALRYSNVYGPRQDPHGEAGVVAIFIEKMLKGVPPVINGDGEQTRDYVYVSDVVNANILSIKEKTHERVFNIGTGIETSVNQIFNTIKKLIDPSMKEEYAPLKQGEQQRSVIDYTRAANDLHWKPEVLLEDGLQKTCEYFKNELKC